MRIASLVVGCVVLASVCAVTSLAAPPPADLGVFPLDVVALLGQGEEVAGDPALAVEHRHYTYLFANEATKAAFEADPDRYAVAQGGACARMGALSGVGKPELWAVHDNRLYFCASEGCRNTFRAEPARVLERDDDPPPAGDLTRGRALAALAVQWAGGAEAFAALTSYRITVRETVSSGGADYAHRTSTLIAMPDACHVEDAWNDDAWSYAARGSFGYFNDKNEALRVMDADQRSELTRRARRSLPALLAAWVRGDADAVALGADGVITGERVAFRWANVTVELVIDPESGAILAQRMRAWGGPRGLLGAHERRFCEWREAGGVLIPIAWEVWFDGDRFERADKTAEGVEIIVNEPLDAALFAPQVN